MDYTYMVVTNHALQQYRKHDPHADTLDIAHCVQDGIDLDEDTARPFRGLQGKRKAEQESFYVLAPSRRGMFVLVHEDGKHVVITYLRFQQTQEDLAWELWPDVSYGSDSRL